MASPSGFIILTIYIAIFQVIVVAVPWSPHLFSGTAVPATDGATSVVIASANPTSSAPPTTATGQVDPEYALTGFDKCTERGFDISHIKDGFSDMIRMIGRDQFQPEPINNYPPIDWVSAAAIDFWGPAEKSKNYREDIKANLDRAAAVTYQSWWNPAAPRLHARCDDPLTLCTCNSDKGGTVTAYTLLYQPHINFCPAYFETKTLDTALSDLDTLIERSQYLHNYFNRAEVWAHELMHINEIGFPASPYPGITDVIVRGWPELPANTPAYGSLFTKWLAQAEGGQGSDPVDNAENYALFMLANYVQREKGFYPHKYQVPLDPVAPPKAQAINTTDAGILDEDNPFDYEHYCYVSRYGDAGANAVNASSPNATAT